MTSSIEMCYGKISNGDRVVPWAAKEDATRCHVWEDDVTPWSNSACLVAVGEPHVVAERTLVMIVGCWGNVYEAQRSSM